MNLHSNRELKLLFLGSSCIYPKFAEQPIKETSLLTGLLEPTNEPYAIAKIAGIKLCESYNSNLAIVKELTIGVLCQQIYMDLVITMNLIILM